MKTLRLFKLSSEPVTYQLSQTMTQKY